MRRCNAGTCFSPVGIKLKTVQHSLSFPVSWCVVSEAEEQKCLDLAGSATARNIRGTLLCVRGQSPTDCMEKIKVCGKTALRLQKSWLEDSMELQENKQEIWEPSNQDFWKVTRVVQP